MVRVTQGPRPEDDFTLVSNTLMRDPKLPDRAKAVYLFMRSHRTGWALSTSMISEALNRSRNTVMAAINDLIDAGYVERVQGRISDGKFGVVEYVVHSVPRGAKSEQRVESAQNLNTPCSKSEQDGAQNLNTPCSNIAPVKKTRKKTIEKTRENTREDEQAHPFANKTKRNQYAPEFEKFWSVYPRKIGDKRKAQTYFGEQIAEGGVDRIIEAAEGFRDECLRVGTAQRYIPYPATWLNQQRWKNVQYRTVQEAHPVESKADRLKAMAQQKFMELSQDAPLELEGF